MPTSVERVLAAAGDPPLLCARRSPRRARLGWSRLGLPARPRGDGRGVGRLVALHVDYGLRDTDSDADDELVARLSADLGVAPAVIRAPPAPARGNLQAWARDLRYEPAVSRARAREARIAAGHTASDQVETILYRFAASPGRRALLGMPPPTGS